MDKIIDKLLRHSKETKTLIGAREYNAGDNLYVFYVLDFNDALVALQNIGRSGEKNGIVITQLDSFQSFESDNDYLYSYQMLFESIKEHEQHMHEVTLPGEAYWQYSVLADWIVEGRIIGVDLNREGAYTYGRITDFDEQYLILEVIDKLGNRTDSFVYRLSDITELTIDDSDCRKREQLFELKRKAGKR